MRKTDFRQRLRDSTAGFRPWLFMVPYVARGGNFLYFWLWADRARRGGHRASVMYRPEMRPWLEAFPALRELTHQGVGSRWSLKVWQQTQRYGTDFSADDLHLFVESRLLSSPTFADRVAAWGAAIGPDAVTINVRRGDYYSVPEYNRRFGLDIPSYVDAALPAVEGRADSILFVSDDPEWCTRVLAPRFGSRVIQRPWVRGGFLDDFAALAGSRRLVLSNSTFSYWGAYVSSVVNEGVVCVAAPALHERTETGWRAFQHAPEWATIEDPSHGQWLATESLAGGTSG